MNDLVLTGGHVIDPAQGIDRVTDVAFKDGRAAGVGDGLAANAREVRDVSGHVVTPGLIDLHTHVYWGGTSLGIDAEEFCRMSGVTTAVDTGSAGPGNFMGFRNHVIDKSEVRILAYLHISFAGIYAFSNTVMVGESEESRHMAPADCARVADENRDVIVGIKVRCGKHASGTQGWNALQMALQVADETGLPLMAHIDHPPPTYAEIVSALRPGDILTHCFRPFPNAPCNGQGAIMEEVHEARKRGVIFDVGHGGGSFAFKTARNMLAGGFEPDTISSDVHTLCIGGPAFDQVTTMSKFLCMGMPLDRVVRASTVAAADALQRPELGTLKAGAAGDATVLTIEEGSFDYHDVVGEVLTGDKRIRSDGVVVGGKWWWPHAEGAAA